MTGSMGGGVGREKARDWGGPSSSEHWEVGGLGGQAGVRPQCSHVLYPESRGGTQRSVFETVLRLPRGAQASGGQVLEAAAVIRETRPEPGDYGARQEVAGLGAICGKINVAMGNRT